jgi:hypothetical protein
LLYVRVAEWFSPLSGRNLCAATRMAKPVWQVNSCGIFEKI